MAVGRPFRISAFATGFFLATRMTAVAAEIDYQPSFTGLDGVPDGGQIATQLNAASQLVALEDRKPSSVTSLRRRAEADMKRLKSVLESAGYYDAGVSFSMDMSKSPVAITVLVQPGKRYLLSKVEFAAPAGGQVPEGTALNPVDFGLIIGGPALAAPIAAADGRIVTHYQNNGWPLVKVLEHKAVIDTATKTMTVTYIINTGPIARFGETSVDGLTRLDSRYVRRRIAWTQGELYDQRKVDKTRDSLIGSALFGAVTIEPAAAVSGDGTIAMRIHSAERVAHTVSAGGSYNTTLGIAADVSWEDRDLFGGAENLKVTAQGGTSQNLASVVFRNPDVGAVNQDIVAKLSADNELVDAFRSIAEQASLGIERLIEPGLTVGISGLAEHARINEIVDTRTYTLVGLPLTIHLDRSNDLLNPTNGFRVDGLITPYIGPMGSDLTYAQAKFTGTGYQTLDSKGAYVMALRGILGGTFGTSLASIPKDHRFFAGGGGSVRGFGYQKASPLDQYYNPVGGRSLLGATAELRMRVTDTIGLVPFLDAAEVSAKEAPTFMAKVYAGAGIGLRYYTAIGPLRLDLATPLDPRSRGDSPIQVYVSLGQAF